MNEKWVEIEALKALAELLQCKATEIESNAKSHALVDVVAADMLGHIKTMKEIISSLE